MNVLGVLMKAFRSDDILLMISIQIIQIFFRPWTMNVANTSSDFEAPKDPGAHKSFTSCTDTEILGN